MQFKIEKSENSRVDKFLGDQLKKVSRSRLQKLLKKGQITVNGSSVKSSYILLEGDVVDLPDLEMPEVALNPESFDYEVLYEDDGCFVMDKPAGVVVHPGEDSIHATGSVANAILTKVVDPPGPKDRPGIVHRLDKDTSGLLIIAKTDAAYLNLLEQFKSRKVEKEYLSLVKGGFEHDSGIIEAAIGRSMRDRKKMSVTTDLRGKKAVSQYSVLDTFDYAKGKQVALVAVKIETGRTHQIRVHMSSIKHPVVGDNVYGQRSLNVEFSEHYNLKRQFLHAHKLSFISPVTEKKVEVVSDLPGDLKAVLEELA